MGIILVYVTHKTIEEARIIAKKILGLRLIACANYSSIKSEYLWQDNVEAGDETVTILKSIPEH